MAALDPILIFDRLSQDLPPGLLEHVIVTGSLAAAYEYRVQLQSRAVNTKDADLVVHPAGDVVSARQMAEQMLQLGWRPTDNCKPSPNPEPPETLAAIRLLPPQSNDYFIELLNVPAPEQDEAKKWIPVQLRDGWYGLPSFKFMGLVAVDTRTSEQNLKYASPPMMALANLFSHPNVSEDRIESGDFAGIRRCAKDLGRAIALAALAGRNATETWPPTWQKGIEACFPNTWRQYATSAGNGLRGMLADDEIMEQARATTESGLLSGKGYNAAALRGIGERLIGDVIEVFER